MSSAAQHLTKAIMAAADPQQAVALSRFFRCGKGQYGEGDKFLGVKVPQTRAAVKAHWRECNDDELESLMTSPWHELRLAALLTLVMRFKNARRDPSEQAKIIEYYLGHTRWINNWDLVDLSCYELLGAWLLDKPRTMLYNLAADGRSLWEQRIAMVSTMAFVRRGQLDDTYALAEQLLGHPHDLIHKAVGWLLREAGKRDAARLELWLRQHIATTPRTTLRYAIEKFPENLRRELLSL